MWNVKGSEMGWSEMGREMAEMHGNGGGPRYITNITPYWFVIPPDLQPKTII
jgi:hypothetical protein